MIEWQIPPSMPRWIGEVPTDRPVVLLLRHSVRNDLPQGDAGYTLPITEIGRQLGRELGASLASRLRTLRTSPLHRCVQTAEVLREGAGIDLPIENDHLLGDPGAYVLDGHRAWSNWQSLGHEGVMTQLVSCSEALPGMARPDEAARFLVHQMLAIVGDDPGIHVFVTHDSLVTATAARLLGQPLGATEWPWYLEGAFFWRDGQGTHVAYRGHRGIRPGTQLCSLESHDVIEFARREIAMTVGLQCPARFFLAGGAFKTLLTGQPPRDLDLWAPSVQDREALISTLNNRGALHLPDRPFADAFEIAGRVIEVAKKIGPTTLEEQLARFDIALSAVGVEHCPEDQWTTMVHPLAHASVQSCQILLLKPLVNWKYALVTLERMRRYAEELGYSVSPEEETEIWSVFEAQEPEMRKGMIQRYCRTAIGSLNVAEEATCRMNRTEIHRHF
jgi:broad specificity phosphatase PhoE